MATPNHLLQNENFYFSLQLNSIWYCAFELWTKFHSHRSELSWQWINFVLWCTQAHGATLILFAFIHRSRSPSRDLYTESMLLDANNRIRRSAPGPPCVSMQNGIAGTKRFVCVRFSSCSRRKLCPVHWEAIDTLIPKSIRPCKRMCIHSETPSPTAASLLSRFNWSRSRDDGGPYCRSWNEHWTHIAHTPNPIST